MSETMWHVSQNGGQQGPFPESLVRQMLGSGRLGPTDLLWRDGMPQWLPAQQVPGLVPPGAVTVNYASPQGPAAPDPNDIGQNAGIRMLIPVGRSGWAIAAGYLGLFSFVILPAPLSLIISIIAIRDIKTHPGRHGMGRAIFGLIMGILGTIVCVPLVIAMLARH